MLRHIVLTTTALILGLAFVVQTPAHAATHDGDWSALIITEKGTCDQAYRYNVAVTDGRVRYRGDAKVDFRGSVEPNGAVKVNIRLGDQGANGTGRLSATSGTGTWHGEGKGSDCAGRWEAERR